MTGGNLFHYQIPRGGWGGTKKDTHRPAVGGGGAAKGNSKKGVLYSHC